MSNVIMVTGDTWEAEVSKATIPVLVEFGAQWCGPCKALSPILNQLAVEYAEKIKIVNIDVDNNMQLAKDNNIRSVPTMMIFIDGIKTSDKMVGFMNKEMIKKTLEKYIEKEK